MQQDSDHHTEYSHRVVGGHSIDVSAWPTPDEGALAGKKRDVYFSRKSAVLLYLQGAPLEQVRSITGLGAKQAYRLVRERCLALHDDGQPYGWRGLIPYLHIQAYKRHNKISINESGAGGVGAMQTVLDSYPDLRLAFERRISKTPRGNRLQEVKLTAKRHWIWFLDELRRHGCEQRGEWPFNTTSFGYYSVRRHVEALLEDHPKALAATAGGPDMVRKLRAGNGSERPVARFLQRVEMDAHKLDGRFCVSIPDVGGGCKERLVHRLWVTVLIDVTTRVVVGYYFSMGKEVTSDDVLRAVKRALTKWEPRHVTFAKEPYRQGAGLLSTLGKNFIGLCWDETSVDGALAETCKRVKSAFKDCVGSTLLTPQNSYAKRRSLDDRPFIETFFRTLAGRGFQRLSNTTGGKASERKGRDPETVAMTSRFQYEYAEELLDVLIANYNVTPHAGIGKRTPLAYAKTLFESAQPSIRQANPGTVESLISIRKLCTVRGGAKVGRQVYVDFYYARYANELLQNRQDLVGTQIWVIHHKEDDGRVALASTLDGMSLGVLRAAPPWHMSPHSLPLRKAICQAQAHGKLHVPAGGDAIESFITYVEAQPANKLPVHPAYLEARRILAQSNTQFVGESLLKAAQDKLAADSAKTAVPMSESEARNADAANTPPRPVPGPSGQPPRTSSSLPPRRLAATKA
jgi:transposase InsO family protein